MSSYFLLRGAGVVVGTVGAEAGPEGGSVGGALEDMVGGGRSDALLGRDGF